MIYWGFNESNVTFLADHAEASDVCGQEMWYSQLVLF
jgi:hypothetical protein